MAFSRKTEPILPSSLAEPPSHFFKVILSATLEEKKLRIPEKFVRRFGDELSDVATIREPNGRVWHVKLMKDGKKIWFHDGWHDFVNYHSISVGYFLVFKYERNSDFHLLIFDKTACEVQYPRNCEELVSDEQKSLKLEEMKIDNYVEKIKIRSPAMASPPQSSKKVRPALASPSKSLKCNMEEVVEMEESCHGKLNINEMCNSLRPFSRNAKTKFGGDDNQTEKIAAEPEFLVSLQDMGIYVARNFGFVSEIEKERAINVTRSFKSKNPSFMAIIRPRNIHKSGLYVPAKFSDKYLSRDSKLLITLEDSDGKEWPVQMNRRPRGGSDLRKGWSIFAKEKLNYGDIVVFELIKKDDILFKVSVFHSTMELGTNN